MLPIDTTKTYIHKSSKREYKLILNEQLIDTQKWINGESKSKWVLTVRYEDTKELKCWLIGYNNQFEKVVKCKEIKDENKDQLIIKIQSYD